MDDNKIIILMDHTIHHNEHHAEDFDDIASKLKEAGADEAANLAEEAAKDVQAAVDKLKKAEELYKQSL